MHCSAATVESSRHLCDAVMMKLQRITAAAASGVSSSSMVGRRMECQAAHVEPTAMSRPPLQVSSGTCSSNMCKLGRATCILMQPVSHRSFQLDSSRCSLLRLNHEEMASRAHQPGVTMMQMNGEMTRRSSGQACSQPAASRVQCPWLELHGGRGR